MKKIQYASEEHKKYVKKLRKKKAIVLVIQISVLLILLCLWEIMTRIGVIDGFLFSSPTRIATTIADLARNGELFKHIFTTLSECILGFTISMAIGFIISVLLWWSETTRKVLDPYIVILNSLPKIALGPIIIVWVGVGMSSIITMTVLISVIVSIISILNGFMQCDPDKIILLRSMGASKLQTLNKLIVPNSIPNLISVLKVNVGLSWVGTIMGEYLSSRAGLGYLIVYGGQVFKLDLVMASTLILCVLAGIMYFILTWVEKFIQRRR